MTDLSKYSNSLRDNWFFFIHRSFHPRICLWILQTRKKLNHRSKWRENPLKSVVISIFNNYSPWPNDWLYRRGGFFFREINVFSTRIKRNADDNIRVFFPFSRERLGNFLSFSFSSVFFHPLFGYFNFCVHLFLYHASNVDYLYRRLISDCPHVFTSRWQLNTQSSMEEDRRSIITMIFWFRKLFEFVFYSHAFDRLEHKRERERNSICKLITVISCFFISFNFFLHSILCSSVCMYT